MDAIPLLICLSCFAIGWRLGRGSSQTQRSGPDSTNIQSPHAITVVLRDTPPNTLPGREDP